MTASAVQIAWDRALPNLRAAVDQGLLSARVEFSSNVTVEEWIHGEPSLGVYWSVPSSRNWEDRWGRSISLLLVEVEGSWHLRMWGAKWFDDWSTHKRTVATVFEKQFDAPFLTDVTTATFLSSLVVEIKRAILEVEEARPTTGFQVVSLGDYGYRPRVEEQNLSISPAVDSEARSASNVPLDVGPPNRPVEHADLPLKNPDYKKDDRIVPQDDQETPLPESGPFSGTDGSGTLESTTTRSPVFGAHRTGHNSAWQSATSGVCRR